MALPVADVARLPVIVSGQKSVGVAILLAFLFGPLGMIYSTGWGALAMFAFSLAVIPATDGIAVLITVPFCMMWAGTAASSHNDRLRQVAYHRRMQSYVRAQEMARTSQPPQQHPQAHDPPEVWR